MLSPFKLRLTAGNEQLALDCNLKEKPSFTKDPYVPAGFLIPSNRGPSMQFYRGSAGTYVDSDGLIKYASENLLHTSEDVTTWTLSGGAVKVSYNSAADPLGGQTADIISFSSSSGLIVRGTAGVVPNLAPTPATISAWVRVATGTGKFRLQLGDALSADLVATTTWTRYSFTVGTHYLGYAGYRGASDNSAVTLEVWGAQLERSSAMGAYIPTSSVAVYGPRYDHDPITGACKGLLIEEQRTNALLYSQDFTNAWWSKMTAGTITGNATTDPAGGNSAALLANSSTTFDCFVRRAGFWASNTTYTYSVFLKRGPSGHRYVGLYLGVGMVGNLKFPYFDFDNPTVVNMPVGGTFEGTVIGTKVDPYPNGWYRVIVSFTTANPTTLPSCGAYLADSNGVLPAGLVEARNCYIWGMQSELGTFATSYIPTTTASVLRARDYLGVYRENFRRDNLLVQGGGNMLASPWTFTGSSLYATVADPFGGNAGQEVLFSDTVDIASGNATHTIGAAHTLSVYLKKSTSTWLRVYFKSSTGSGVTTWINFTGSGALGSTGVVTGGLFVRPPTFESVGGGWYRLSVSAVFTGGSVCNVEYRPVTGDESFTHALSARFCFYGAQIENGPEATPYIAANLIPQSQAFDAADWGPQGSRNVTVAANTAEALAPDGTQSADKCTVGGTTAIYQCVQNVSFTAGMPYTASIYVNGGDFPQFSIWAGSPGTWPVDVIFNLSGEGSVASTTGATASIVNVGNGWYRCSVTAVALVTTGTTFRISPARNGTRMVVGNSTDKYYLWGAQLEYGATATEYIPTLTAAASFREDRLCSKKLTMVCDFDLAHTSTSAAMSPIGLPQAAANGITAYRYINSGSMGAFSEGNSAVIGTVTANTLSKVALAYDGDSVVGVLDGGAVSVEVGAAPLIFVSLLVGSGRAEAYVMSGHISRVRYFQKRLPNPRLQALTL